MKAYEVMVQPRTIRGSELATKARTLLRRSKKEILVTEGNKPTGIIDNKSILKIVTIRANLPAKSVARPILVVVSRGMRILNVARLMLEANADNAVVLEKNRAVGIVDVPSLLKGFLKKKYAPVRKTVREIITSTKGVQSTEHINTVLKKLERHPGLPVLKKRELVGIVQRWDFAGMGKEFRSAGGRNPPMAKSVMRTPPVTIDIDSKVEDATKLLVGRNTKVIVAVKNKNMVGIISDSDLLKAYTG